jgi:peptide deformylase
MIASIAQLGAEVLRRPAEAVTDVNSAETREIIATLRATLASTEGVGIAAPQISISKQIMIVASRPTARYPNAPFMPATVMINPSFQALSEHKEKGWEGCLSVPSIRALVPRYTAIKISYLDEQDRSQSAEFHDFLARVFQHELDHLHGKVFLDSVDNNRDIFAESEYFKLFA